MLQESSVEKNSKSAGNVSTDDVIDLDLTQHIHTHINTSLSDVENIYKQIRQHQSTRELLETDTTIELDALRKENQILGM